MPERRYISFKVDDADIGAAAAAAPGERAREACSVVAWRYLRFCGFCLVCTGAWLQALAPWMLSAIEVAAVLLLLLLMVRPTPRPWRFNFRTCLEDVVVASLVQAAAVSAAYAYSSRRRYYRPYLYVAYAVGSAGFVYALVKGSLFLYSGMWLPPAALIATFASFSWAHILAARRTVEWARRRTSMGLLGQDAAWGERGAGGWPLFRRGSVRDAATVTAVAAAPTGQERRPSSQAAWLAAAEAAFDSHSRFVEVEGLKVHVREAEPPVGAEGDGGGGDPAAGVLLLHGFGGGTFAWRHIQEVLAAQCGVRVVAFDRPGFGVTERPAAVPRDSLYSAAGQARLTLRLCQALGLRRVVLVGHGEGCLVALMAAALAAVRAQGGTPAGDALGAWQLLAPAPQAAVRAADALPAAARRRPPPVVTDLSWMGSHGRDPTPKLLRRALRAVQRLASVRAAPAEAPGPELTAPLLQEQPLEEEGEGKDRARAAAAAAAAGDPRPAPPPQSNGAAPSSSRASAGPASPPPPPPPPPAGASPAGRGDAAPPPPPPLPAVQALVLLHPTLGGRTVSGFTRLLARTSLGRGMVRSLLRSEIGEVANRRAWHEPEQLTPAVLELYKAPLTAPGWDDALLEVTRPEAEPSAEEVLRCFAEVQQLPVLLATGEFDRIATPTKLEGFRTLLPRAALSVLPDCGHLSHEERPGEVVAALGDTCRVLLAAAAVDA